MDIELAIDMLEMAQHIDHAVLFSGDGDFRRLVEAVQRRGVRVSVVSTIRSSPPMVVGRSAPPGRQLYRAAGSGAEHHAQSPSARRGGRARSGRAGRDCLSAGSRAADAARAVDLPPPDCPLCPRLAAFRAAQRERASGLVQRAGAVVRRPRRGAADRRSRAGTARREPHRAPVHRRLCRRAALPHAAQIRLRGRRTTAPTRRTGSSCAAPASPTRSAACRRRTSRKPPRSRACGRFSPASWRRCRGFARSWRSARSRITPCSPPRV